MIPEEMYQTLDETSLEHWVMELPDDEAGCEFGWDPCAGSASWRLTAPCGTTKNACGPCNKRDSEAADQEVHCCGIWFPRADVARRPI